MAKYSLTNKAVDDLSEIYEYTYENWSEFQADKYYEELIDFCQMLAEKPKVGRNYEKIDFDFFGFLANKHIIFYKILNSQEIEVERILGADTDLKNKINV